MSPPIDHPCLHLHILDGTFFVRKLQSHELNSAFQSLIGSPADNGPSFLSITRTSQELSVVGEYRDGMPDGYKELATWKAFKIAGPMEFNLTGVLAGFVEPLKRAEVPVFAISTYDTDYILVPKEKIEAGVRALKTDGWTFASGCGLELTQ
ncbi:ACT domain-containing protein [Mycena pura]|uniref:ACT domain-containing protein n=1 Tax=Mycena pura TaxID=153505 RepID=A0AAD6Y0C3_9AGAR|nr:ACT domain-containing protein [Mycena pura]